MKPVQPVLAILDLWALGHSASQIATMLGLRNHKAVTKVVAQARSIGDRRAVLHTASNGRLIGRPGRMARPPVAMAVPGLGKPLCAEGHARSPDNLDSGGHCRACKFERRWERRA